MGPSDTLNDDDDDLAQLLLAAENETEANGSKKTSTEPALRESSGFAHDLANGTRETSNDIPGEFATTSGTSAANQSNGFSAELNRSLQEAQQTDVKGPKSIIASNTDNLDSSDDEDVSNFLERKYNEYGRDIKSQLKRRHDEKQEERIARDVDNSLRSQPTRPRGVQPIPHEFPAYKPPGPRQSNTPAVQFSAAPKAVIASTSPPYIGIYTDPVFGLRIIHPLISSTVLQERMSQRTAITMTALPAHIAHGDKERDWAIAGVIVHKSNVMTSKKGSQYVIWKLSDLRPPDLKQITVFLFKGAYKDLWKTAQGMAVAILNPGVMDNDKAGETTLSLDTAQKCMLLGQSKDIGTCKAKKKNGDPCTALVNRYACEYCVFHVKQEYNKMSSRVELQSATSGRGLEALRNKVLGKSEVFYGGQSYMATPGAVPAKKNARLAAKDQKLMLTLSGQYAMQNAGVSTSTTLGAATIKPQQASSHVAGSVEASSSQRQRDLERLKILEAENERFKSPNASAVLSKNESSNSPQTSAVPAKFRNLEFSSKVKPSLKREGFSMELGSTNISQRQADQNKAKALAILRKSPIVASNPNFVRHRGTEAGRKRAAEELSARDPNVQSKRAKITDAAERFQNERIAAIIGAKSSHANLVEEKHLEAQTQYFDRLEKKEAMEEKMLGTFSIPCKAVTCLKCKYTAFSASDRCKEERHPLKVIDAEKRFFECKDCGSRTATVHRMPQMTCKNCQSSRWQRAAMVKDRCADGTAEKLSIRGDEETFIGGAVSGGNLNLCVSADD